MTQTWFVTGSSRGLGRAVVEAALDAGHQVVATARTPSRLDDLVARHGDRIHPVALDVTDFEQAQRAVRSGLEVFGRYDVVVNNAGYGDMAAVEDVTLDDFRAQIDTNFYGVVHVTKAVLPTLREQGGGHIFQISSIGGRLATVGMSAYQSAKWAVGGFSSVLAQEVAPLGIKVTVVEPGGMRTDWAGPSMTVPPVSDAYQQTVGAFAEAVRSGSGHEETDPCRVAHVLLDLAHRDDAPVRLVLGAQAYQYVEAAARVQAESDARWRPVSESVSDRRSSVGPWLRD
ncbi:SDR family NAD(P)-dependent oxidoreductase [Streptomyces sp. NPDC046870]|uniref:SDR family NAD(P)-dependent oxidoreductase n=1 Tax=Streptomyces sp. NPDC046870 TaxID=3155135 RepID=UPI0034553744